MKSIKRNKRRFFLTQDSQTIIESDDNHFAKSSQNRAIIEVTAAPFIVVSVDENDDWIELLFLRAVRTYRERTGAHYYFDVMRQSCLASYTLPSVTQELFQDYCCASMEMRKMVVALLCLHMKCIPSDSVEPATPPQQGGRQRKSNDTTIHTQHQLYIYGFQKVPIAI